MTFRVVPTGVLNKYTFKIQQTRIVLWVHHFLTLILWNSMNKQQEKYSEFINKSLGLSKEEKKCEIFYLGIICVFIFLA